VECRQDERERRLRHTRARGKRLGEALEALVAKQLVDECVENWVVHHERRNSGSAAAIVARRGRRETRVDRA
jgi:hypothetical protein